MEDAEGRFLAAALFHCLLKITMRVLCRLRSLCVILQLQVLKGADAQIGAPKRDAERDRMCMQNPEAWYNFPREMTIALKAGAP